MSSEEQHQPEAPWEDDEPSPPAVPALGSSTAASTVPMIRFHRAPDRAEHDESSAEEGRTAPVQSAEKPQEAVGDEEEEDPFPVESPREDRRSAPVILLHPSAKAAPEEEPFERPRTTRMGILGGKGVGKSYLFQGMVYRTFDGKNAGALSYFIDRDSVRVYQALAMEQSSTARSINVAELVEEYTSWMRLLQTQLTDQKWYRLRLQYRTGLLGRKRSFLDVDFLDGSGEDFEAGISRETEELWKAAFLDARIMVFCLPLWAAFPASGGVLSDEDWEHRDRLLKGFEWVVKHFKDLREKHNATHPVRSVLALTMADDRRSALTTLRNRWITPFLDNPWPYLKQMRKGSGVARYLADARRVSEALLEEFEACRDPRASGIPERIDLTGGRPWIIPVSAIEGAALESVAARGAVNRSKRLPDPVPVHVELPLLVALCETHNALV